MTCDDEIKLDCLAKYVVQTCSYDTEQIREWLAKWRNKHGEQSYRDLRERCGREWINEKPS